MSYTLSTGIDSRATHGIIPSAYLLRYSYTCCGNYYSATSLSFLIINTKLSTEQLPDLIISVNSLDLHSSPTLKRWRTSADYVKFQILLYNSTKSYNAEIHPYSPCNMTKDTLDYKLLFH